MLGLSIKIGKILNNTLFGRALVRIRATIEKNTIFGKAFLVRFGAKTEKNTLFRWGLVKIRAK